MAIIISISTAFFLLYFGLILLFAIGWKKLPEFTYSKIITPDTFASVVIACRNEEKNLDSLLNALSNQSHSNVEFIIIDDHSTDGSRKILEQYTKKLHNLRILSSKKEGKKNALKEGILEAKYDFILTTDADCIPPPHWITTTLQYQETEQCDMIIGAVSIDSKSTLFSNIQKLEFVSLISSGAGATGIKKPIMCNGANLAFKKEVWMNNINNICDAHISGDDVFMMHAMKKQNRKIHFLKSPDSIVLTQGVSNLREFIIQRERWASKSKFYTDAFTITTALIVFINALQLFLLLSYGIFSFHFLLLGVGVWVGKWFIDYSFLSLSKKFFDTKHLVTHSFYLSIVYPFYVVYTSFNALIKKQINWK